MKLICPLSGISYTTNVGYGHGQAPHPVFYIPLRNLIAQNLNPFCDGKLSEEELHLFGCALLHKLPVIWERQLDPTKCTKVWKAKLEKLATVCLQLDDRQRDKLPQYHIDKHNPRLDNLGYYLESINEVVAELACGEGKDIFAQRAAEETIVRMLRQTLNKAEKRHELPTLMADWAKDVAEFPTYAVTVRQDADKLKSQPLCEFWHGIIVRAFTAKDPVDILSEEITAADVDELIEHCEHNIEVGTIHSSALLRKLRDIRDVLDEFRSPAPTKAITIAARNESLASALLGDDEVPTKSVRIDNAPQSTAEPLRKNYPNMGTYLAAKLKWQRG